ncbi:hypothetical protein, partial [Halobacillus trueperi]
IILAGLWPLFFGPPWAKGIEFMTIQTVFGVFLFMMPLMNMGAFGLEVGIATPIISMIRHWAYGLVVGSILPPLVQLFQYTSASQRDSINT